MSLQLAKLLHFNARVLDIGRLHYTVNAVRILASRLLSDARCNRFQYWALFDWINQKCGLALRTIRVANTARIDVFFALNLTNLLPLRRLQHLMSEYQSALRSAVINRAYPFSWL